MSDRRDVSTAELNDLAGGWGSPAAVQYSIDHLPGSSTSNVGYDFSVSLGLLLGDLAAVIEAAPAAPAQGGDDIGGHVEAGSGGGPDATDASDASDATDTGGAGR